MKKVLMYTKTWCPYCVKAKMLLNSKGVEVEEINVEEHSREEFQALMEKTGMRTVPQIFIDDQLVGGYDELAALDAQGELDPKLGLA